MRTIKFREFINGKFHYWGFVEEGIFKGPVTPSLSRGKHDQFTGLKDKNGKEIYEGDILEWIHLPIDYSVDQNIRKQFYAGKEKSIGEVVYGKDLCWRVIEHSKGIHHLLVNEYRDSEIIDNIYENPELL